MSCQLCSFVYMFLFGKKEGKKRKIGKKKRKAHQFMTTVHFNCFMRYKLFLEKNSFVMKFTHYRVFKRYY